MCHEMLHFRDSFAILKKKKMMDDITETLEYLDTALWEAPNKGELLKEVLKEKGWRRRHTEHFGGAEIPA